MFQLVWVLLVLVPFFLLCVYVCVCAGFDPGYFRCGECPAGPRLSDPVRLTKVGMLGRPDGIFGTSGLARQVLARQVFARQIYQVYGIAMFGGHCPCFSRELYLSLLWV